MFKWTDHLETCFVTIKNIVSEALNLTPINASLPDPTWVVCDTSVSGIGAYYGQGKTWDTCSPTGFHLHKFSDAQWNYRTHEQELLANLEALMAWEDKLLGRKFKVITDHRSLEFFQTQGCLPPRQSKWWEYLSRFNFDVEYVKAPPFDSKGQLSLSVRGQTIITGTLVNDLYLLNLEIALTKSTEEDDSESEVEAYVLALNGEYYEGFPIA